MNFLEQCRKAGKCLIDEKEPLEGNPNCPLCEPIEWTAEILLTKLDDRPKTLKDYSRLIEGKKCDCGHIFKPEDLRNYEHPGGHHVLGWVMPQWLYAHCPMCKYDYALWKMGIPSNNGVEP